VGLVWIFFKKNLN